jgi:hypothetical protein
MTTQSDSTTIRLSQAGASTMEHRNDDTCLLFRTSRSHRLRPSPLRHVRLGRHRSFGAIMTDHEQALRAARDSLRNIVSIRDFLLAVQVGSQTAKCSTKPRLACLKCWRHSPRERQMWAARGIVAAMDPRVGARGRRQPRRKARGQRCPQSSQPRSKGGLCMAHVGKCNLPTKAQKVQPRRRCEPFRRVRREQRSPGD